MGSTHQETETSTDIAPESALVESAKQALQSPVTRNISSAITQAKLQVGAADDPYEREADQVADAVMRHFSRSGGISQDQATETVARTPISRIARSHFNSSNTAAPGTKIARSTAPSAAAGPAGGEVESSIESRIQRASGGGDTLDGDTRSRFEGAMGTDLGNVRIHANSGLAPQIGAHAFTHGSDVHFAPGAYNPGSASGQHLLAHELTHVVQQTGSANRVQAKLWSAEQFREKTAIKSRVIGNDGSTAQDVILSLLAQYEKFLKKGFSSADPGKAAQAVSQIRAMQDVAQRWLDHRGEMYEDTTNYNLASLDQAKATYNAAQTGGEAPAAAAAVNPKAERMAGLQAFVRLCDTEIALMSQSLDDDQLAGAVIDESNKKYKKAKARYPDQKDAKSAFGKVGRLADMAVGTPGSTAELEITADIPVQPGVYVTFGISGSAERGTDSRVKLRFDVKVGVKGKISGAAEISATLGGFIEANGKDGVEAATLMSYALYRRGREGAAPTAVISTLWGGSAGTAGLAKSEEWSRTLEEQVWGDDAEGSDEAYVQSGGTVGAKAALGAEGGPVSGELSVGGFSGRKVDKQSLMDRKGGAGEQNVKSDSILNAGKRQKRVGADVFGWNASGQITVAGFTIGLAISQTGRRSGGGASGKKKTTEWEPISVEASGSGTMPPALDIGAKIYQILEKMVREAEKAEKANGDPDAAMNKSLLKSLAMTSPSVLSPNDGFHLPAAADLTISVTFQGGELSVALGTKKESKLPIPDILKVKLTKTQAFFTWSSKDGPWVLGA